MIMDHTGNTLDSSYKLESFNGIFGLILESWGPSTRNPEYNKAFEIILERLMYLGVSHINIYVISAQLIEAFPNKEDRAISINGITDINLQNINAKELRLEIGRKQASLKIDSTTTGGNRTKRILIHNPNIDFNLWTKITKNTIQSNSYIDTISEPTNDIIDLNNRVSALMLTDIPKPQGVANPKKKSRNTEVTERDPKVKAWILKNSIGICEYCNDQAPFIKSNGEMYLEVHHVLPLSENGSDTLSNTIAVCPNCHMELHHGKDRLVMRKNVIQKIDRLVKEQ